MSYVVDKEIGFPIPSEKEKINRALKRYRRILAQHPQRSDTPEIMFGIADLLVGRSDPGDYAEAMKIYDQILLRAPHEYLRARALVGKAELLIGDPSEFDNAISLCEKARQILDSNVSEFFSAKTFMIEAELRLARKAPEDWKKALKLTKKVIQEKKAHWYFRGRALLSQAEITFYQPHPPLGAVLKILRSSHALLKPRADDYFTNKGKILEAEVLIRRAKKIDFERAEKALLEVLKIPFAYKELIARAKLDLAEISRHPQAQKLLKEVGQMEGLDPYLIEKSRLVAQSLKERKKK